MSNDWQKDLHIRVLGELKMSSIRKKMLEKFGKGVFKKSALLNDEWQQDFIDLMNDRKFQNIVEIGTFRGVSAAFLSQYAKRIITIDLVDSFWRGYEPRQLWNDLKIENIKQVKIKNDIEKIKLFEDLKFDMAFIDGDHGWPAIIDWLLVRRCGNVLFHDYGGDHSMDFTNKKYCPVKHLVDSLPKNEVTIKGCLAFWDRK